MAKIYRVEMNGKTSKEIANSVGELKKLLLARCAGRKNLPHGTKITKVGLTKDKPSSKPVGKVSVIKAKPKRKPDQPKDGEILTGPDGKTYRVGQRGRMPSWVEDMLTAPVEGSVVAPVTEHRSEPQKGLMDLHWFVAQKAITLSGATYVVEIAGKPQTNYASADCEVVLGKGTKYAIVNKE